MKFIDDTLMKEVISILEASYSPENPLTKEEKNHAVERIKIDYENSKTRIAEFRQEFISNKLVLQKIRKNPNREISTEPLDSIINEANSYEDDIIYLYHTIYQTTKDETSLRVKIDKLGQEIMILSDQFSAMTIENSPYEEIKQLAKQITEKGLEIDAAVKEVHIQAIMNAYYQRLSRELYMGNMRRK